MTVALMVANKKGNASLDSGDIADTARTRHIERTADTAHTGHTVRTARTKVDAFRFHHTFKT